MSCNREPEKSEPEPNYNHNHKLQPHPNHNQRKLLWCCWKRWCYWVLCQDCKCIRSYRREYQNVKCQPVDWTAHHIERPASLFTSRNDSRVGRASNVDRLATADRKWKATTSSFTSRNGSRVGRASNVDRSAAADRNEMRRCPRSPPIGNGQQPSDISNSFEIDTFIAHRCPAVEESLNSKRAVVRCQWRISVTELSAVQIISGRSNRKKIYWSTQLGWKIQPGQSTSYPYSSRLCIQTMIWKGGTIASIIVLIAAAFPSICSQNCFTQKCGTSACRRPCCQRTGWSGTHDDAMQISTMNWRNSGRNTRLASGERRNCFVNACECNYLSRKLPTPTQTNEQSQTIITSCYFKHDLLMCACIHFTVISLANHRQLINENFSLIATFHLKHFTVCYKLPWFVVICALSEIVLNTIKLLKYAESSTSNMQYF